MSQVYFISGIDTGVGKTIVTGLLACYLQRRKVSSITCKIVQTGNDNYSEDRDVHRKMTHEELKFAEDAMGLTAPQIFKFPSSPLLAAKLENRTVDVELIASSIKTLAESYDIVLAEGAGGLAVPLTTQMLSIDLVAREKWQTILVTCGKLGSINHTILSLEALRVRNMKLAAVIYNYTPNANELIDNDSFDFITQYLANNAPGTPLVRIPTIDINAPINIDFKMIFGV